LAAPLLLNILIQGEILIISPFFVAFTFTFLSIKTYTIIETRNSPSIWLEFIIDIPFFISYHYRGNFFESW
jgi:hypothetical protein